MSEPKPFNLRCPKCNWFLVEVERAFVESDDDNAKLLVGLRIKCPNCKTNVKRTVEGVYVKLKEKSNAR